jgi:hypothetical protein
MDNFCITMRLVPKPVKLCRSYWAQALKLALYNWCILGAVTKCFVHSLLLNLSWLPYYTHEVQFVKIQCTILVPNIASKIHIEYCPLMTWQTPKSWNPNLGLKLYMERLKGGHSNTGTIQILDKCVFGFWMVAILFFQLYFQSSFEMVH